MRSFARSVSPALVLALTVLWLLLNQSVSPWQMFLGAALGVPLAWASSALRPLRLRLRRIDVALGLLLLVFWDVVRSNIQVARLVLDFTGRRKFTPGFLDVPIELREPHALATLAVIFTSTPGTVWAGLSPDGRTLRLHVLDLVDENHWIHLIKDRYEPRLKEIFE